MLPNQGQVRSTCEIRNPAGILLLLFCLSVVSNSLRPHELQHTRPPCPSPSPGVHLNSCPLSRWCHPTISSSVIPFSSSLQSFPTSGFLQMSQSFTSDGQSTGVSASASFLPKNTRTDLLQNGLVGSPCSPRDSQVKRQYSEWRKVIANDTTDKGLISKI